MNSDLLDDCMVKEKLNSGELLMVINNKDRTSTWSDLRLIADAKDSETPFVGWAVCRYCCAAFRTHSKINDKGKRKNHGLTSCMKHLEQCSSRKKQMAEIAKQNSSFDSASSNSQPSVSQFLTNKKKISPSWLKKLKEAETKFIVGGMHSFKSIEHTGLQNLVQTCVDIGARCGKVDIRDIWFGRKSIRDECHNKFSLYKNQILKEIQKYAVDRTLSATTDLWRDDAVGRYYLDFTVFWIDHTWQLNHALLRCKHFEEQSKTAINLWSEIESIFNEFNLILGDTPITTDEGANIKASLKNEIRVPCMAHRSSTTLETAWEATRNDCPEFDQLVNYVSDLRAFIARSGNIQTSLPMTIKRNSATRPWRSYYIVYHSVFVSYDKLIDILSSMFEENRILSINKNLLSNIVDLMKNFVPIFDSLEFSKTPTIHIVVPSYYAMMAMVQLNGQERPAIKILKQNLQTALDEKYNRSVMQIHWIATYLDPSFRELSFVSDKSYRTTQLKSIKDGLLIMANDIGNERTNLNDNSIDQEPPLKKSRTEISVDPFAQLRCLSTEPPKLSIKDELTSELSQYSKLSYSTTSNSSNPSLLLLDFWCTNEKRLPLLSIIAKRILVIQGSSSESERHFSAGGTIVSEKRSRASASTVESLVVLRECYINGQWPDGSSEGDKEKSETHNNNTVLTPDVVSL